MMFEKQQQKKHFAGEKWIRSRAVSDETWTGFMGQVTTGNLADVLSEWVAWDGLKQKCGMIWFTFLRDLFTPWRPKYRGVEMEAKRESQRLLYTYQEDMLVA